MQYELIKVYSELENILASKPTRYWQVSKDQYLLVKQRGDWLLLSCVKEDITCLYVHIRKIVASASPHPEIMHLADNTCGHWCLLKLSVYSMLLKLSGHC